MGSRKPSFSGLVKTLRESEVLSQFNWESRSRRFVSIDGERKWIIHFAVDKVCSIRWGMIHCVGIGFGVRYEKIENIYERILGLTDPNGLTASIVSRKGQGPLYLKTWRDITLACGVVENLVVQQKQQLETQLGSFPEIEKLLNDDPFSSVPEIGDPFLRAVKGVIAALLQKRPACDRLADDYRKTLSALPQGQFFLSHFDRLCGQLVSEFGVSLGAHICSRPN